MKQPDILYSIFDKPGDYWEITKKDYEVIIDNKFHYDFPIEVIIPTYKRPKLLLEALDSAINQDVDFNYLITIIDNDPDSSNENLLNKNEYRNRIRYIRNKENLGLFGNWNRAIQVCRAPFIALLHDDDLLGKNYLSTLIRIIDKYPNVGVITHTPYQIKNGNILNPFSSLESRIKKNSLQYVSWKDYLYGNITSASCMVINKQKAIEINGWSSKEFPSADWFFNARMAYNYTLLIYYSPMSYYRWLVNASLESGMNNKFYLADINFMLNNLDVGARYLSNFSRLRIKLTVIKIINHTGIAEIVSNHPRIESLYTQFIKMDSFTMSTIIFLSRIINKISREINWMVNTKHYDL